MGTMKSTWRVLVFLALVFQVGVAAAQEGLPTIPIGGGQTQAAQANGQLIQVSAAGVSATVYFDQISSTSVRGLVVRTSGGTTAGDVTVRWVNRGRSLTLHIDPANPDAPFSMEGGEGDKRVEQSTQP